MMYEFLINNRADLAGRCRDKVANRPGRQASEVQLQNGVPMFLNQLIRTLAVERTSNPMASRNISGPSDGAVALSEIGLTAAEHGKELLSLGFSVNQVVHDIEISVRRSRIWRLNETYLFKLMNFRR